MKNANFKLRVYKRHCSHNVTFFSVKSAVVLTATLTSMAIDNTNAFLEKLVSVFNEILTAMKQPNVTRTNSSCANRRINMDVVEISMIIPSVLILVVLSCYMKRKSAYRQFYDGRPGLAIPMDAIFTRNMRIAYLLGFGCVTPTILETFFDRKPLDGIFPYYPSWCTGLVRIVAVLLYGTFWYPLFATITAELILGYVVGFLFVAIYCTVSIYNEAVCRQEFSSVVEVYIIRILPLYTFMMLMMAYFIYVIGRQLLGYPILSDIAFSKENNIMAMYVRNVFKVKRECQGFKAKLKSYFQINVPGFIYPPRFLYSLLIAGVVLYTLIVLLYGLLLPSLQELKSSLEVLRKGDSRSMYEVFQTMFAYNSSNPDTLTTIVEDFAALLVYFFDLLLIIFSVSTTITFLITVVQFPLILRNYRMNVLQAYKGIYTDIIPPYRIRPSSAILGFSRLVGYQAAYLTWGYFITLITLSLITSLLTFFFFVPLVNGFGDYWINLFNDTWSSVVVYIGILVATDLITRVMFHDRSAGSAIAITNKSLYCIWAYYITFYDIFIGILSCLSRLMKSLVIGLFFIGRIDVPVISRLFEYLDPGYCVYSEFIATEIAHNNPIMRTFLNILIDRSQIYRNSRAARAFRRQNSTSSLIPIEMSQKLPGKDSFLPHHRPAFRWHLFYTLHNNPSLITLRKHYLDRFQDRLAKGQGTHSDEVEENRIPNWWLKQLIL